MEEQGAAEFVDVVVHPGDLFVNRTHSTATFVYQAGDKIPQNNSLQHRMARFLLPPGELVWGAAAPTISQARKDHMSRTQLFEKHRNRLDKKISGPTVQATKRVAILYNTAIGWGQQMENERWPPPKTLQEGMEADNQRNLLNEQMEKLKHWFAEPLLPCLKILKHSFLFQVEDMVPEFTPFQMEMGEQPSPVE
ncbi:hypothetical protein niasHT_023438 [Heterodera trifolii]|uniref:Uncharacterized protein n=1 Tax=Heterodera trifolii TaxID=157864 RepID=A0ABD2K438_9BILA